MELFTLLFKTDNRKIYSGNNMVILGKVQDNIIKIFSLKVNNTVRIDTYFRLLVENDFLKSDFKTVCSAFAVVSGFIIAVSAFFAIAMVIDFNGLFILFHETFFNNDLWLLDPAESRLINMVPLEFFIDTVVNILVRFETCVAAVLILSTAYLIIRLRKRLKG